MQFEKAHSFLIDKLEKGLPEYLHYHNVEHTQRVLASTILLAQAENISEEDLIILKTAALFHDAGFLETYTGHEEISCEMARKWLPRFEYNNEQIEKICKLILVTKMPQSASSKLEEIICDADLFYLGTNQYIAISNSLYKELHEAAFIKNRSEWNEQQLKFLQAQRYFTKSAQKRLSKGLQSNLQKIKPRERPGNENLKFKTFAYAGDFFLILMGVIIAAFALNSFLVPNGFFDGGITGISLLIHEIYDLNLAYVIVIANLPFIVMCVYAINWEYAIKTCLCILLLGFFVLYVPYPIITSDKLLVLKLLWQ